MTNFKIFYVNRKNRLRIIRDLTTDYIFPKFVIKNVPRQFTFMSAHTIKGENDIREKVKGEP